MDWKERMKSDEVELKAIIDRLGEIRGTGTRARTEREFAMRCLARKLVEMRTFVDDCMSGRNAYEQSLLEYRLRVQYPFFSHMNALSSLAGDYVDWSCA
jgi:hypothetical protein